jgi:hypothetical protein
MLLFASAIFMLLDLMDCIAICLAMPWYLLYPVSLL